MSGLRVSLNLICAWKLEVRWVFVCSSVVEFITRRLNQHTSILVSPPASSILTLPDRTPPRVLVSKSESADVWTVIFLFFFRSHRPVQYRTRLYNTTRVTLHFACSFRTSLVLLSELSSCGGQFLFPFRFLPITTDRRDTHVPDTQLYRTVDRIRFGREEWTCWLVFPLAGVSCLFSA